MEIISKRDGIAMKPHFLKAIGPIIMVTAWEFLSRLDIFSTILFPPPSDILLTLIDLLISGKLLFHTIPSMKRIFCGIILAASLAVPQGFLIGWYKNFENFFDFLIDMLRNVSPISLIPITILWFGIGDLQKILLITWGCYFVILLNTMNGVSLTEKILIDAARSMGAKTHELFLKVVLPSALPSILTGLRLSLGIAFVVVIATEMVATSSGLGFFILEAERTFQVEEMYAGMMFIALLGYTFNKLLVYFADRILIWREFTVRKY